MASFEKRGKTWQYKISYKSEDGKYKTKSKSGFRTKAEARVHAEEAEKQLKKKQSNGIDVADDPTFLEYFNYWYEIYKEPHISDITKRKYETTKRHMEKYFGNLKLKQINMDRYQKFINDYGAVHALASVKKTNHQLKSCLNHAEHTGMIMNNPTYKVKVIGLPGKDESKKYLDQVDAKKLNKALLDGYDGSQTGRAMCLFSLATGCRLGEVMALTEDCIDRTNKTVTIKRSWDYNITNDFIETKTPFSVRTIAIDSVTIKVIDKCIAHNKKLALKTGKRNNKQLVFLTKHFSTISPNGVNNALKKALRRGGIEKQITFHSLRHTHASLLILNGVDLSFIAKRLGHSSSVITAEVYTHVLKELEDKGNEQVENLASTLYEYEI